jgi:peptidoglycan/xylan/chitin deacetylase (PgdA/CDA1 family)
MRIDFDGVDRSDGNFTWPNGSRLAVMLSCEYEPVYQLKPLSSGQPNYRQLAEIRYEATRGIWRVLGLLAEHSSCCTFFVNGATAQRFPETVQAIAQGGHEIGAHSWDAADHFTMSKDEEDVVLDRTVRALAASERMAHTARPDERAYNRVAGEARFHVAQRLLRRRSTLRD